MEPVTNRDPIRQRAAKQIRAGEIKELIDSGKVKGDALKWCEVVCKNNPPGQVLHVDPATLETLTSKPKTKGTDENVS